MSAPTVPVTVKLFAMDGTPYVGVTVTAKLDQNDIYQGFVISDPVTATTDADGTAVLNLFPNNPTTGLGSTGSSYTISARPPGGKSWSVTAQIPNTACSLDAVADRETVEGLGAAAAALASAQASAAEAAESQAAADADAASASASAIAANASATGAAGSATSAATSAATATTQAAAASASATAAGTSATNAAASATAASTSATNAGNSAAAAAGSAATATTQSTNAATSATNAATSASNAAGSATTATNQATAAAGSATAAGNSATAAAGSATAAAASASSVATSEANAAASASTASTASIAAVAASDAVKAFAGSLLFTFDTATGDADPGAGKLRLNNAALESVTAAYVDNLDKDGNTITGVLDVLDDSTATAGKALVTIREGTNGKVAIYRLTGSVVDAGGYRRLTLAYLGGSTGALDNGSMVGLAGAISGNNGANGAGSGDMLAANNLSDLANVATARTNLGLVIGTNVQAQDPELSAIAGLVSAADKLPYFTGSGAAALATFTAAGRALVDDADATAQRATLGLGTVATLASTTSTTLAGNSDANVPTEKAVKAYVDSAVTGLMDFKGSTDASASPNYPAALKGDAYVVSVAGKIGGAAGAAVDVGDVYVASADNAGGTQAAVGASWFVLEHNLVGALLAANNLSDLANAATARTNLGLGNLTNDAQTKAAIVPNTAPAAGRILVGNAGGTAYAPVAVSGDATIDSAGALTVANGAVTLAKIANAAANSKLLGSGAAGAGSPYAELTLGSNLSMSGTTLNATGGAAGMTLLATLTPAVAANLDALSVFSSTYDNYLIVGEGIKPSSNDSLRMKFANAGVVDSGASYVNQTAENATATTTTSSAGASFSGSGSDVLASGRGASFVVHVINANDATNLKAMLGKTAFQTTLTGYIMVGVHCSYIAPSAISGVRFLWATGANFAATGSIRIYGISNT